MEHVVSQTCGLVALLLKMAQQKIVKTITQWWGAVVDGIQRADCDGPLASHPLLSKRKWGFNYMFADSAVLMIADFAVCFLLFMLYFACSGYWCTCFGYNK